MTAHNSCIRSIARVLVFTIAMPLTALQARTPAASERTVAGPPAGAMPGISARLPLRFERVDGDSPADRFVARGAGYLVGVTDREATVVLQGNSSKTASVSMRLVGSQGASAAVARNPLPGVTNHLVGNDPARWKLGVRGHAEIEYRDVYPGVAVVYYGNDRQLEYDFVVAPGASHRSIALAFDGANGLRIDRSGQLVIATDAGDLIQKSPVIYQEVGAERRAIQGGYAIRKDGTVGFTVGQYDSRYPLVIDPILSYSTYLGGSAQERGNAVAVDSQGNIVIVGETYSADFPVLNAMQGQTALGDIFVAKLTASGDALVYATYLGGGSSDSATGVAVDATGNAFVAGFTWSWDFPTLNAAQPMLRGQSDSFVVKLDPSGVLVYSTFVGGLFEDNAKGIAVDGQGRAHIVGNTLSGNFPTVNPTQPALAGNPAYRTSNGGETWTSMKTGLNVTGVLSFAFDPAQPSTMYAGTRAEGVFRSEDGGNTWIATSESGPRSPVNVLAVRADGTLYAATHSGVYRSADRGETWMDLHLSLPATSMVLTADGTLYVGTSLSSSPGVLKSIDGGDSWMETGVSGDVQSLAASGSTIYATTGQSVFRSSNGQDWFAVAGSDAISHGRVRAVDPVDSFTAYACGLNGLFKTTTGGTEWVPVFQGLQTAAVAIAPSDPHTVYLATWSGDIGVSNDAGTTWRPTGRLPTPSETLMIHPQEPNSLFAGGAEFAWDAFVTVLSVDGHAIEFSTYFGGSGSEDGTGIAVDADGNTFITGDTHSDDLPVVNPLQATRGGLWDVFVAKLSPAGVLNYATYIGGSGAEYQARVGVDGAGRAHVSGLTWSMFDFPVVNAYQPIAGGGSSDAFVSVLNPAGNGFLYSTYLGGTDTENDSSQSLGPVLAVTPSGDTWIAGSTKSADFPTTADAFQQNLAGVNDAFVTRLDASGQLQFSTYLGGTGEDNPRGIAADTEGVVVAGYTSSGDWPTIAPLQSALAGPDDAFIARITANPPDTIAPETSFAVTGAIGLGGWYKSPVQVTLSATDDPGGSGVSQIEYGVGAAGLQPYSAPFTIPNNGVTVVTARATDNAGNVENPAKSIAVRIDAAPPVVTLSSLQSRDYLHSEMVTLSVSANDPVSGVAAGSTTVVLDGANRTVGEAVKLWKLPLGTHAVTASASDVAGNTSQQARTFRVIATIGSVAALTNILADEGLIEDSARRTLLAKLDDAQEELDRGCAEDARDKLRNVIEFLLDQRGKKLSAGAADTLLTDVRYVRSAL